MSAPYYQNDRVTIRVNNDGSSPRLIWKINGNSVVDWDLKRITEHGNLWLPYDRVKP